MTFSNVVFYLERLQNKEPTTHVITIPRRNNYNSIIIDSLRIATFYRQTI